MQQQTVPVDEQRPAGVGPTGLVPPGLVPVVSVSRRDGVIAQIRRGIVLGVLKRGDKLTELSLAGSLEVSRATVREALGQLSREGLVEVQPYRGLRVAGLDDTALRDLAQTRLALDVLAARSILEDATGGRLAAVRDGWHTFAAAAADPDPVRRHDAHLAFHRCIWTASENMLLAQLWPVIEAHMTLALAQDQAVRPSPERAHRMHALLVEALQTRDLATIEATFAAHTVRSADELIALRAEERTAP